MRIDELNDAWPRKKATQQQMKTVFESAINYLKNGTPIDESIYPKISKYNCKICKDKGDVFASKKSNGNTYMFNCSCPLGANSIPVTVKWSKGLEELYQLI